MKNSFKTLNYLVAFVLLASTGNSAWASSPETNTDFFNYLPALYTPSWNFFPFLVNESTGTPPSVRTGFGAQVGPEGGTISDFAVTSNGAIYAGSWGSGVFKSVDHGGTWTFANLGLTNGYIDSLAVDPTDPDILYAGTHMGGIYKSKNGGQSWFPSSSGLNEGATVYALAINPKQPNIIFAGTRGDVQTDTPHCSVQDAMTANWGGGVFRSKDGGVTWQHVDGDLGCGYIYGLAIDPSNPDRVYVATHGKGVLRSLDGGDSFQYQNFALGDLATRSIIIDPVNRNRLYVSTWHGGAVYIGDNDPSDDDSDGITWNEANGGLSGIYGVHVLRVMIDPAVVNDYCSLLYALIWDGGTGLASSTDCGASWSSLGLGGMNAFSYDLAIDPIDHNRLYLGLTGYGVRISNNRGADWSLSNQGLYNTSVSALTADPVVKTTLYAGTNNGIGIFKSLDEGLTWAPINNGLPSSTNLFPSILKITADPINPGTLYAATDGYGIYKTYDAGATWDAISHGFPSAGQAGLNRPASSFLPQPVPYDSAFFEATESASSQAVVSPTLQSGSISTVIVASKTPGLVYAGSWTGVLVSVNGGAMWSTLGLAGKPVFSLALDPLSPALLYAGTSTGVYKSADEGQTWTATGLTTGTIYDLAIDSGDTGVLYAAAGSSGILKSEDAGATWADDSLGLAGVQVYSLVLDSTHPGYRFAGTSGGLYFMSPVTPYWHMADVCLYNTYVNPVMVHPATDSKVYLGTDSGSIIISFTDFP